MANKIEILKDQYSLLCEKIGHLREAHTIESTPEIRFQLQKQVIQAEKELEEVEKTLKSLGVIDPSLPNKHIIFAKIQDVFKGTILGTFGLTAIVLIMTSLGIAGGLGVAIGWLPTLIILAIIILVLGIWYLSDSGLQKLIERRITRIRNAFTSQSSIPLEFSEWNTIAYETMKEFARQNKLSRTLPHVQLFDSPLKLFTFL